MEDKELNQLIASEQTVSGTYYPELSTAVKLVADILLGFRKGLNKLFSKDCALLKEIILLSCFLVDGFGSGLSVTAGGESFGVYPV